MTTPLLTPSKLSRFKPILDAVLPPRCPVTGSLVGMQGTLAPELWSQLTFLHKPHCACCGNPFGMRADETMRCGSCLAEPPLFHRARAALKYDDHAASLILPFKHADKTLLKNVFTPYLLQAGEELFTDADAFIPVPLHRWRLLKRRYNQAALLAQSLSEQTRIKTWLHALRRSNATESQGHKSKTERAENIRGAFSFNEKYAVPIRNKNVILIDDVLTSGATANECAKMLLKHGAARVDVLTIARVIRNA